MKYSKLPSSGFCKTTNQELIKFIQSKNPRTEHFNIKGIVIGISWSNGYYWFIKSHSGYFEYRESDLLSLINLKQDYEIY